MPAKSVDGVLKGVNGATRGRGWFSCSRRSSYAVRLLRGRQCARSRAQPEDLIGLKYRALESGYRPKLQRPASSYYGRRAFVCRQYGVRVRVVVGRGVGIDVRHKNEG